jgi:P-type Ca2+ transporter type 2C
MPTKVLESATLQGLSQAQIVLLQRQYGKNVFRHSSPHRFLHILWNIAREPMFILLAISCSLYFVLGNINEGIMMAVAMMIVMAISLYQEVRSSHALKALKQFTEPKVTVIRNGIQVVISNEDLVPGDIIMLEEGAKVPADAEVVQSNDLSVNESIITGESLPVEKNQSKNKNLLYQGSTIDSGKCIARVTETGNNTVLAKIGKSIEGYASQKTLLQVQINRFVRSLALFGLLALFVIFLVNYVRYDHFATSLLFALTLAMSAVPEEIPVAFSSFMALGAYKMSKLGIISRQPQIIENLGSVNVICLDKTGTITENRMEVKSIYDYKNDATIDVGNGIEPGNEMVLRYAVLASESNPFDAMEKAIWNAWYLHVGDKNLRAQGMIYEYPLEGRPPMMTHVYQSGNTFMVAGKGATERICTICRLDEFNKKKVLRQAQLLAAKGHRVLGVASAFHKESSFPESQDDFNWRFEGMVSMFDPLKKNIPEVLKKIYDAKIEIKLITGDYPETAINIAQQAGIQNPLRFYTGEEIINMNEEKLKTSVKTTNVFARMFPDAKLRVINAIKANGEIVAMTGDGVNDAPALKASNIGIAMGQKGTETAQAVSDLVLTDDNLEKIVLAVREGRKIYNNLVKAIRYIISIHIPIILTASLPVILGWRYPNIFTPIHVIFLELIMGPTCSIFFEKEPVEESIIQSGPRNPQRGLFTYEQLLISIVQGFMITAGVLSLYFIFMNFDHTIEETRTIVFTTIILSNVFLTFASRSFTKTLYYTSRYKNRLAPLVLIVSTVFLVVLHFVAPIRSLFQLVPITFFEFGICLSVAFVSVMWFEVYKTGLKKH